jgi:hypothetical protein
MTWPATPTRHWIQELKDLLKGMDGAMPEILYGPEGMIEAGLTICS